MVECYSAVGSGTLEVCGTADITIIQDSLGSLEGGAGFPREFEMAVQDSQGNFKWGCRIPMIRRGAVFLAVYHHNWTSGLDWQTGLVD